MYFFGLNKRRVPALLLIMMFCFGYIHLSAQFSGGSGTSQDPWQIDNIADLNAIRGYLGSANADKHFIQTNDIDLRGVTNWNPIGASNLNSFRGRYDGRSFIISNLTIDRPEASYQGLFGYTVNAEIRNVGLIDVNIIGGNNTGALTGNQEGGTVFGCFVTGRVEGGRDVGGLTGYKGGVTGSLTNSYSAATVVGNIDRVGGIVGFNQGGQIRFCYSYGRVISNNRELQNPQIGALLGYWGSGVIANNYWNTETTGQNTGCSNTDITGKTSLQMIQRITYMAWDFPETWQIIEDESFPYLVWTEEAASFNYPPPLPPQNLTALTADTRVELSWEQASLGEPDGYNVYRSSEGVEAQRINEQLIVNTSYIDTDVENNRIYKYYATAVYDEIESAPSFAIPAIPFVIGGGNGTEANPYLVSAAEHLDVIRVFTRQTGFPFVYFRQTAEIDLSEWNNGQGWTPIGDDIYRFSGSYDGNNFAIKDMKVTDDGNYKGLFGYVFNGVLKNIRLDNVDISGGESYVGGLAGYLAGESTVTNCSVSGMVGGVSYIGGLIGYQNASAIYTSFSSGRVAATDTPSHAGGLVGYKTNQNSSVVNSYSTSQVTGGSRNTGGLIGTNWNGNIDRCYAAGSVYTIHYDGATGGLVGHYQSGNITNSYWNSQSTGQETSAGGGESRTTVQMLQQATFQPVGEPQAHWNFTDVWRINQGETYPYLSFQVTAGSHNRPGPYGLIWQAGNQEGEVRLNWQMVGTPIRYNVYRNGIRIGFVDHPTREFLDTNRQYFSEYTYFVRAVYLEQGLERETSQSNSLLVRVLPTFGGGTGSELNPYQVNSVATLRLAADSLHAHFIQTANIDLNVAPYNTGQGWKPIGSVEAGRRFTGSFNGNGFTISNLMINRIEDHVGLFGYTQGVTLRNITLTNVNITGNQYVGAIAGFMIGDINGCRVTGIVRSNSNYAGGVTGYITGDILNSSADINLSGSGSYIGGLAGHTIGEAVNNFTTGYVAGTGVYIGGLIGLNRSNLNGCYSSTTVVSSSSYIGGLVGDTYNNITACRTTGNVQGNSYVGGIAGHTRDNVVISESYSTATVYGTYRYIGGIAGMSRGRVERSYATGSVTGNDRHIGGLVGYKRYGDNVIIDSYATGSVTSNSTNQDADVGGLVGYHFEGEIRNSYSTGLVTGVSNQFAGGMVGRQEEGVTTVGSFWNTETSGRAISAGGTGRTTTQMFQENTYTGANWDFINVWRIEPGETYPYLQWQQDIGHNRPGPRNLSANAGNQTIQLMWNPPVTLQPQGYNLYRNGQRVNTEAMITQTQFADLNLTNYRTYVYYVVAVYDQEEGIYSGPSNNVVSIPIRGSFSGGNGTAADPFVIDSAGALWEMRRYLGTQFANTHFRQTADIDLGVEPFIEGQGWEPIGNGSTVNDRFNASFNGNGYTISNMTINRGGSDYVGLFGFLNNTAFSNVFLQDISIQGRNYVGGITGYVSGSTITNSSVTGNVRGNTYSGGLVGFLTVAGSTISGSYTQGEVYGGNYVGGLIGYTATTNSITNCYTVTNVTGSSYVGGFIGDSRSNVTFSYSTGLVIGRGTDVGPFAGRVAAGSISPNCYWNIETSGHNRVPGNVFGGNSRTTLQMTQQQNYDGWNFATVWNISDAGYPYLRRQTEPAPYNFPPPVPPSNLIAVVGSSRVILSWNRPSFGQPIGYKVYRDNTEIARIGAAQIYRDATASNNVRYSYFITALYDDERESQASNSVVAAPVAGGFAGGNGTVEDPYRVVTPSQLDAVRYNPSLHYLQVANINLGAYPNWTPIGSSTVSMRFTGTYDGGQYVISNLRKTGATTYSGLFGYTVGAELKNIAIENANFAGSTYSGTLVGFANSTLIRDCYAMGVFQGSGSYTGGLAGYLSTNSSVENCFADVHVTTAGTYAGGLVGGNSGSPISNSYATGNVTSTSNSTSAYIGGLVGYGMSTISNSYASGNVTGQAATAGYAGGLAGRSNNAVTGCFATGDVVGNRYVGGLVGYSSSAIHNSFAKGSVTGNQDTGGLIGDNRSSVNNCYSFGRVFGQGDNIGGLVGVNTGTVITSYWNTETSGLNASAGGEGRTIEQMTYPYADNTYVNWNFNTVWVADSEGTINNWYPFHSWIPITVSPLPKVAANPTPAHRAVNIPLTLTRVEWDFHPSILYANPVGFRVYMNTTGNFGEDDEFSWVNYVPGQTHYVNSSVLPAQLETGTTYYWQVVPTTNEHRGEYSPSRIRRSDRNGRIVFAPARGDAANCPIWSFTTIPYDRPTIAVNPQPVNEAEDVSLLLARLSWEYQPNPGYVNPLGFRVYLDTEEDFNEEDFEWVAFDEEQTSYSLILSNHLQPETMYYWKVIPTTNEPGQRLEDNSRRRRTDSRKQINIRGDAADCPIWRFTTRVLNSNPTIAENPDPADRAVNIPVDRENIGWNYNPHPEYSLPAGFRVYMNTTGEFQEEDPFVWVAYIDRQVEYTTGISIDLEYATNYYWQVVPTTFEPVRGNRRMRCPRAERGNELLIERGDAENCPIWRFTTATDVKAEELEAPPLITRLIGNYPNPFNPETTISFELAESSVVMIYIYNVKGQLVRNLLNEYTDYGYHRILWNGLDDRNRPVGSGIYYYRLESKNYSAIGKMTMVK